ncbi:gamma-glutamyltransferase [Halobacteriovorax marinus]|uniref:Glutathione hydrolase proenzyme n=1 Tax=Halobacteriovorax marinus (strain ATCC BAA-682 / DSM 15412 / SJ) TaxID=862908 RepID=E1X4V3_HALMS|nr:gamma-glutamyltransferase [Halobacteriovorax marinus]ATH08485.1 gamma-glutamyltransferase [Halobacteriovorax marinus]CBW27179.1 gamma-glutamyltranspeptidase precursor [Halobacteriovorax marinus SJ]
MKKIYILSVLALISSCSAFKASIPYEKEIRFVNLAPGETREDHEKLTKDISIATQGRFASQAAYSIFKKGGNIIDAATTASFVLAVERPQSTGLGGGGFALFHDVKRNKDFPLTVDFREKAPIDAHEKMFLDDKGEVISRMSLDGIFSAGVPGMVAGMLELHKKHGKLPLAMVLKDAIDLARNGFKIYPELAHAISKRENIIKRYKATCEIFCNKKGEVLKEGDLLVQKDLAKTIETISKNGRDGFYKGRIARALVGEHRRLKGLMTQKDLDKYEVKYRTPIRGDYKGYEVFSMSPPSSGGVHIVEILNILRKDDLKTYGLQHSKTVHLRASAMQAAFSDRANYLGDTDFTYVPVTGLTSKKYADDIRFSIPENKALNSLWANMNDPFKFDAKEGRELLKRHESNETTHFTIADGKGNIFVSTQTLNGYLGSGVVVPGTGILLNNEMDDFATKPGANNLFGAVGGEKNLVQPEKRPLSSMSPTIVMKDGKPVLGLGSPSGTRILTCVVQTIMNYIDHNLPLYESMAATRVHHQWKPNILYVEESGLPERTIKELKRMEHEIEYKKLGCRVQAISFEDGMLRGVSDIRGRGLVSGE